MTEMNFTETNEYIESILSDFDEGVEKFRTAWVESETVQSIEGILVAHSALWQIQRSLRTIWYRSTLADAKNGEIWTLPRSCSDVISAIKQELEHLVSGADLFRRVTNGQSTIGSFGFRDEGIVDVVTRYVDNAVSETRSILGQLIEIHLNST